MIQLLLDIGNTRLKWGLRSQDTWLALGYCQLDELQDLTLPHSPIEVFGINVAAKSAESHCEQWAKNQLGLSIQWLQSQAEGYGVRSAYLEHQHLGVDRWAAMIGAYWRYQQALCVVSCGTAITVDIVAADGQHRGGVIMPGVRLLRQSLLSQTANIQTYYQQPNQVASNSAPRLGQDTSEGVTMGSLYAGAGLIDKVMQQWQHLEPRCILTGGDASYLAPYISSTQDYHPDLVLYGVHLMAVEST